MASGSCLRSIIKQIYIAPVAAGLLLFAPGCDGDKDDSQPAEVNAVPMERPAALSNAIVAIKGGRAAEAQAGLEVFIEQEPKSVYRPEAQYLLGQSLAAQGKHEAAKKMLDEAIDSTDDRTLKGLAMLGRADCNMALKKYSLASRQYHWLETMYREVPAIPQDELMYKLGLATKKAGNEELANYWFKKVVDLYATGAYAELARKENTKLTPNDPDKEPVVYTLEVASYGTENKAEAEADILRSKQYRDVQVIASSRNGFPNYEVHIGKFRNSTDAVAAQTDAQLAGLPTTIRPALVEPLK